MITKTKHLVLTPCTNDDALHDWVRVFLGLKIPRAAVCANHDAPFEYLRRAYFEPAEDMIVWAPRGGGKTRLAAVATLLDLLHKPGVAVRILGGSLEQSLRMWEHLVPDLERLVPDLLQSQKIQSRRLRLKNGSTCAVLTQSQRAVRGLRVQKLRCDEVELFDAEVWEAAQLVTRSSGQMAAGCRQRSWPPTTAGPHVDGADPPSPTAICPLPSARIFRGSIEALSTHHRPFGLMNKLIETAGGQRADGAGAEYAGGSPVSAGPRFSPHPNPLPAGERGRRRIIKWCVLDVLQRCEPQRECRTCSLWDDCRGVAKTKCDGFIPIDDAIALKHRVSAECWAAEMMCQRPSVRGCVFPSFDPATHVREDWGLRTADCVGRKKDCGLRTVDCVKTAHPLLSPQSSVLSTHLSLDFGFANPFVCLWLRSTGRRDGASVHVIDEYVQPGQTIDVHLQQIQLRQRGPIEWIACDPAGNSRSDQTAASNITLLRRAGYRVRYRTSRIVDGLEMIRAALRPAAGAPRLSVHPRCTRLIAALRGYRYPDPDSSGAASELPLKDGEHDHLIDALRYFFINNIERRVVVSAY